jgi:hypothetical protein
MRSSFLAALIFSFVCLVEVAAAQMGPVAAPAGSDDFAFIASAGSVPSDLLPDAIELPRHPVPELTTSLTLPRMSPELALQTYEKRAAWQAAELGSYSATTVVRAELPESSQQGEFELERHYAAPHTLEFKAVQFTGDGFVKSNVITRLLQSEVDHVQKDDPALTAITQANYKFSYKATPMIQGRMMHVYQIKPRKKRAGLFKGRIYLDAYTGSLLYATGMVVKSPSFFVKKIEFVQEYSDFGRFTFPVHMHSEATARLVGRAIVDIYQSNYQPVSINVQSAHQLSGTP